MRTPDQMKPKSLEVRRSYLGKTGAWGKGLLRQGRNQIPQYWEKGCRKAREGAGKRGKGARKRGNGIGKRGGAGKLRKVPESEGTVNGVGKRGKVAGKLKKVAGKRGNGV